MKRSRDLAHAIPAFALLFLLSAGGAFAQDEQKESPAEPEKSAQAAEGAVYGAEERVVETLEEKGGRVGFNFVSVDRYGGRAAPFGFLHSSGGGGLYYRTLGKDGSFDLEGSLLNGHDYHGDLLADYKGDYRLHLRTESLHHNLDRETLFPSFTLPAGRADQLGASADYNAVQDPAVHYGVSVRQDLAAFRYRLHNFPLHVNLAYWRMTKDGTLQQRFADTSFEGPTNNIFAVSRGVDRQTQEGRLGVDAHLGWVDLIYDFRVRVFEDRLPIPATLPTPSGAYEPRQTVQRQVDALGGVQQHNEDPNSRYLSHTVKLHTSLTGGIVGSASYSIDQRENLSHLTDVGGIRNTEAILQNVAGDLVYTPCAEFSLALKYRRQELDHDDRRTITDVNYANPVMVVKPPVSTSKDIAIATLTFRPQRRVTVTGEYRGEYLRRGEVSPIPTETTWGLPQNTATQRGSLGVLYHPVKGVRLTARYDYETTDHPSYGNSFEQKHEGKLLASYTGKNWGLTGNLSARREWNDRIEHFLASFDLLPGPLLGNATFVPSPQLSRQRFTENANFGGWYSPVKRLTLSANYAWMHNHVDQGVLFTGTQVLVGGVPTSSDPGSQDAADFISSAHVYGVGATWGASERLDLSLLLQQIRSDSAFTPKDRVFSAGSDTSGIRDISRQDTVISSVSARGDYRFSRGLATSLEYTLQDYNEKNPVYRAYNGTVHAVVAYLTAKW